MRCVLGLLAHPHWLTASQSPTPLHQQIGCLSDARARRAATVPSPSPFPMAFEHALEDYNARDVNFGFWLDRLRLFCQQHVPSRRPANHRNTGFVRGHDDNRRSLPPHRRRSRLRARSTSRASKTTSARAETGTGSPSASTPYRSAAAPSGARPPGYFGTCMNGCIEDDRASQRWIAHGAGT